MIEQVGKREKPSGLRRAFFRFPILLFEAGLGFLFGERFLLLRHVGRKSGRPRETVLEVAHHDESTGVYQVASGFGSTSDWYRNVLAHPEVEIQVGRRRHAVVARPLSPEESGEAMVAYWRHHPKAARQLQRLLGLRLDETEEDYRRAGREYVPFVDFAPRG